MMSSAQTSHAAADALLADGAKPFNLVKHRAAFHERALGDVNINSTDSPLMLDPTNPKLVTQEVAHQKEQWSNLKFTYLELEAKRNFVMAISEDDPQTVQPGENEALEQSNAEKKRALKAVKAEIEGKRDQAIRLARESSTRHAAVTEQLAQVQSVQKRIRDMELELARIKATYPPEKRMTIERANQELDNQTEEMQRLETERSVSSSRIEEARVKMANTAKEIQRLERERDREEARAKEVQEGREAGDTKVDEMCRWLNSSTSFYKNLMGIRSVTAPGPNQLQLEYEVPGDQPITLILAFDPLTKALGAVELHGVEHDLSESINLAIASNDAPGLIADILGRVRRM